MKYPEVFYFRYNDDGFGLSVGRGCENSLPIGGLTIAAILVNDKIQFGYANCSIKKEKVVKVKIDKNGNEEYIHTWKQDNFVKKTGNEKATTMALEHPFLTIDNVDYDAIKTFVSEIAECYMYSQLHEKKLMNFEKLIVKVEKNISPESGSHTISWTW